MIERRDMLIALACAGALATAEGLRPRHKLVRLREGAKLTDIVPARIAGWAVGRGGDIVLPRTEGSLAARLYSEQRSLAEALQRSLLTSPPQPDHSAPNSPTGRNPVPMPSTAALAAAAPLSTALLAAALLSTALAVTPALAQTSTQQPSMTQPNAQPSLSGPAPNMGSPQAEQTGNQQPGNVRNLGPSGATPPTGQTAGATKPQGPISGNTGTPQASGQQLSQPTPTQNQSQAQQTQGQQPGNVRDLPPTASAPTNDPGGATKPQGPVNAPAARAQGNQPASTVTR